MDLGLENRVALVTGSSRGLGRAVAEALLDEGARVMLCARGKETLAAARDALDREAKGRVEGTVADVSRAADVDRLLAETHARFGPPEILVTNSGGPPAGPFEAHDVEAWREAVRQLLESAFFLIRGVLPEMKRHGWGRIVNVTSIAVKQPVDGLILSNSVRAAVTGMARTLANEVAKDGITVNNVMPGYTRTERVTELAEKMAELRSASPTDIVAEWEAQIPAGRLGDPRELAALTTFLASDRAGYITGASIPVDGGWLRGLL